MAKKTNLEYLRELTSSLPDLAEFEQTQVGNVTMFEVEDGPIFMFDLLTTEDIKVIHTFMPRGAKLGEYIHPATHEVLIVTEGRVRVNWQGPGDQGFTRVLGRGRSFYAFPSQAHCVEALEDSWVVALLTPYSLGGRVDEDAS